MLTIPRHLRDVVVTEYGVADLRGQDDETCIRRMLAVADAEFQPELLALAKRTGKLARDYALPAAARANRPENLARFIRRGRERGFFAEYPFGSDFTEVERRLVGALARLKARAEGPKWKTLPSLAVAALLKGGALGSPERDYAAELARMGLERPRSIADRLTARALRAELRGGTG
jgi:hypothetical protein